MKHHSLVAITSFTPLKEILELGSHCVQSGHCCSFGSGFVMEEDIHVMANFFNITEDEFKNKYLDEMESFNTKHFRLKMHKEKGLPYGKCVFLDDGKRCKIHEVKPLHCRVGTCSGHGEQLSIWFALNYFVDANDPESIRQWAVYLKTHPTIPGGELKDLVPDEEELKKILSYEKLK